jgi:hypothetical protein
MHKAKKILGIVTHPQPHLDEIFALWLLYNFGKTFFVNIEDIIHSIFTGKSGIYFHRQRDLPEGISKNRDSYIFLGTCGGPFDEHQTREEERKEGECCATLVAKFLGVSDMPELALMLKEVKRIDLISGAGTFHLASIIAMAYKENYPFSTILQMAFVQFNLLYSNQKSFHSNGVDFQKAQKVELVSGDGRKIKVVFAKTDNTDFSAYARFEFGDCQDVIVQMNNTGNVQIFTRRPNPKKEPGRRSVNLDDLARILRLAEQQLSGEPVSTDWTLLSSEVGPEGTIWYYQKKAECLLNGSTTAPNIPPTKIPFEQFPKLVQIALTDIFPADRTEECQAGNCTHRQRECSFYPIGLTRCQKVRGELQ